MMDFHASEKYITNIRRLTRARLYVTTRNFFELEIFSEVVSRNNSHHNSKNNSQKKSCKTERLLRQDAIVRGFQNLNEVSKILTFQLHNGQRRFLCNLRKL